MKRLTMILILCCLVSINYSNAVTISTENLGSDVGLLAVDSFNNQLALLGIDAWYHDGKRNYHHPVIKVIENNSVTTLPDYIETTNGKEKIIVSSNSRIKYDNNGNLWLTGKSLYKYANGNWKEYFHSDDYSYVRYFCHLAVDANNNVWVTTSVFDKDNINSINFSELYMFNGFTFERLIQRTPEFIYSTYGTVINSEKLIRLQDGRIAFHKTISRQGNEEIDSLDGDLDLIIYESGNIGSESYQIRTYNWDSSYNKLVNNLLPDNEKIWFAHNGNVIPIIDENFNIIGNKILHRGLSVFDTKSKDWYIFDKKDGLPFDTPELPAPVKAITRLSEKLMLMYIYHKLYLINQDYQVEETNWDLILSDATIYKSSEHVSDDVIYETLDEIKNIQVEKLALIPRIHKMFVTPDNNLWILSSKFLIKSPIKLLSVGEKDSKEKELIISPNPTHDFITIQTSEVLKTSEVSKMQIFDVLGIEVGQSSLIDGNNRIDISHLPAGVYFVRIGNKVEKFVKM